MIFEDIKKHSKFQRAYYLVYCLRRIIFVAIALFLNHEAKTAPQLVCVLLLNLFVIIYIGSAQALEGRKFNKIDLMNETFVAFITLLMVAFTDFA